MRFSIIVRNPVNGDVDACGVVPPDANAGIANAVSCVGGGNCRRRAVQQEGHVLSVVDGVQVSPFNVRISYGYIGIGSAAEDGDFLKQVVLVIELHLQRIHFTNPDLLCPVFIDKVANGDGIVTAWKGEFRPSFFITYGCKSGSRNLDECPVYRLPRRII